MRKNTFIYSVLLFLLLTSFSVNNEGEKLSVEPEISFSQYAHEFYSCINDKDLNTDAFKIALNGYFTLLSQDELLNKKYLTIIDMSVSANEERFFVIDMETQQVVYKSLVAHGRNTGEEFATHFSNKNRSYQTSLGFYKTAETYNGKRFFKNDIRCYSHGCVRVQHPLELAKLILEQDNNNYNLDSVNRYIGNKKKKTMTLNTNIPIHIQYFTCGTDTNNNIVFYEDIYNLDEKLEELMGLNN